MEQPIAFTGQLFPERWYRRPSTWLLVAVAGLGLGFVALRTGFPVAGTAIVAVAAGCAIGAVMLIVRRHRAARAEIVAMIDANLAARDADPHHETEEDARQRAAVMAFRDRLSRPL